MDEFKNDVRFIHITKDPRFRPISKKEAKLKIDRRFASMFNDPKLKLKYTVDKRGRSLIREQTIRHDMNHLEQNDSSTSSDEQLSKKTKLTINESDNDEEQKSSSSEKDEDISEIEWNEFDDQCTR